MIVSEAIALMESDGLAAVSLRSIARRLDAQAPSLYRHIKDKEELCRLMSWRIFHGCLARIPRADNWRNWLISFGEVLWDEQHRTPGALELIAAGRQNWAQKREPPEEVIEALTGLGLDRAEATDLQSGVQSLATGWTMLFPDAGPQDRATFLVMLQSMIDGWMAARKRKGTDGSRL